MTDSRTAPHSPMPFDFFFFDFYGSISVQPSLTISIQEKSCLAKKKKKKHSGKILVINYIPPYLHLQSLYKDLKHSWRNSRTPSFTILFLLFSNVAMGCDKGFSSSYMLLKPEEVRFFDLIHILFSSDIEKRKFVDAPEGTTEESFRRRWLMFVSILTQKFLQFVAKPLSFVGSAAEMGLNLVSSNRNLFVLLLNALRGQCALFCVFFVVFMDCLHSYNWNSIINRFRKTTRLEIRMCHVKLNPIIESREGEREVDSFHIEGLIDELLWNKI